MKLIKILTVCTIISAFNILLTLVISIPMNIILSVFHTLSMLVNVIDYQYRTAFQMLRESK